MTSRAEQRDEPQLLQTEEGLALVSGDMVLKGDFSRMLSRVKPAKLHQELLVKAARIKGLDGGVAADATAGLGEDAFLLAAAGYRVLLFERNAVTRALLQDALQRGAEDARLASIVERMTLMEGDSIKGLAQLEEAPDLIYLDPMFPAKRKDAATKKKLQMLQMLEQPCDDEEELMQAALAARPRRVVVKRPLKGEHLAGMKPSHSLEGKVIRYDCYVLT